MGLMAVLSFIFSSFNNSNKVFIVVYQVLIKNQGMFRGDLKIVIPSEDQWLLIALQQLGFYNVPDKQRMVTGSEGISKLALKESHCIFQDWRTIGRIEIWDILKFIVLSAAPEPEALGQSFLSICQDIYRKIS
jgi:hypothetical protein